MNLSEVPAEDLISELARRSRLVGGAYIILQVLIDQDDNGRISKDAVYFTVPLCLPASILRDAGLKYLDRLDELIAQSQEQHSTLDDATKRALVEEYPQSLTCTACNILIENADSKRTEGDDCPACRAKGSLKYLSETLDDAV